MTLLGAIAIVFKGVEDTRFFGRPTASYASANTAFEMPDGALVMVASANDKDWNGVVYGANRSSPTKTRMTPSKRRRRGSPRSSAASDAAILREPLLLQEEDSQGKALKMTSTWILSRIRI